MGKKKRARRVFWFKDWNSQDERKKMTGTLGFGGKSKKRKLPAQKLTLQKKRNERSSTTRAPTHEGAGEQPKRGG